MKMNRQERELRLVIREMVNEAGLADQAQQAVAGAQRAVAGAAGAVKKAFEDLTDKDGAYVYRVFPSGALQIIKSPKNLKVNAQNPLTVSTKNPAYKAIVGSLKSLYADSSTLAGRAFQAISGAAAGAAKAASDALAPDPNAPVTTDSGVLGKIAGVLGTMSNVLGAADGLCNPTRMPLWVWPFINFIALRKSDMVITNDAYCQALHRVCDAAWARGGRGLANPGDIATAQNNDPAWNGTGKQGIVGADVSFAGNWNREYEYDSANPYMHIAMSLTNFSWTKNGDGTYNFSDTYDFNEPGKVAAPLGNPDYMLQNARAKSRIFATTTERFMKNGMFAGIEDLMRYYEATLKYGGFKITGKTIIPAGYKPAQPAAAKKPVARKVPAAAPAPK